MSRPFFVASAALAVVLAGCVSQEEYRRSLADNDNLRQQRDALSQNNRSLQDENQQLKAQLAGLSANAVDAEWVAQKKAELEKLLGDLNGRKLPEGVSTFETAEGVGFEVQGAVLFASGKAEITPSGESTLRQLVQTIEQSGRRVRIDGHTDTDPIRHSAWRNNLELSAARSLAVAEFLIREGVPADRVAIAGFGQYRPAETGDGDAAKARNRRVEILMLHSS